jgi:hypothetical protein
VNLFVANLVHQTVALESLETEDSDYTTTNGEAANLFLSNANVLLLKRDGTIGIIEEKQSLSTSGKCQPIEPKEEMKKARPCQV